VQLRGGTKPAGRRAAIQESCARAEDYLMVITDLKMAGGFGAGTCCARPRKRIAAEYRGGLLLDGIWIR